MNELRELPKKKSLKVTYEGFGICSTHFSEEMHNLAAVTCPACHKQHVQEIGKKFDCFNCGATIRIPVAVGVK